MGVYGKPPTKQPGQGKPVHMGVKVQPGSNTDQGVKGQNR